MKIRISHYSRKCWTCAKRGQFRKLLEKTQAIHYNVRYGHKANLNMNNSDTKLHTHRFAGAFN